MKSELRLVAEGRLLQSAPDSKVTFTELHEKAALGREIVIFWVSTLPEAQESEKRPRRRPAWWWVLRGSEKRINFGSQTSIAVGLWSGEVVKAFQRSTSVFQRLHGQSHFRLWNPQDR